MSHEVKVLGRGTIVYDGPQDPEQRRRLDAEAGLALHRRDRMPTTLRSTALTCIVRSRTWSIQMKDSTGFIFDDLRVIGGNPGNANQDGMDWLGGGDTMVRNAFFRASDDVFAMEGNWDGYTDADMLRPGHRCARHPDREQRALDQHLEHRARRLAAERSSTRATLPCATPTFSTPASAPAGRPSACSASGARKARKAIIRLHL